MLTAAAARKKALMVVALVRLYCNNGFFLHVLIQFREDSRYDQVLESLSYHKTTNRYDKTSSRSGIKQGIARCRKIICRQTSDTDCNFVGYQKLQLGST